MFTKAAEKGHPEAQENLGWMYLKGEGTSVDNTKAFKWYSKAAEQGVANAQYILGILYGEGIGVTESMKDAAYWINLARQNDHQKAKEAWNKFELWKYE